MPNNKQRREAERRRLQRQLQRRQQQAAVRRRVLIAVSVLAVLAVAGIVIGFTVGTGGDHPPQAGGGATTPAGVATTPAGNASTPAGVTSSSPGSTAAAAGNCTYNATGNAARKVNLPPAKEPAKGTAKASLVTSQGKLTFTLDRSHAPCAVGSFVSLAKQNYFNSTPCHRLTTSGIYVLQCGDPTGTGSGGPGYSFNDELTGNEKYTRGVLAMANAGPNTNGSQFFIVYKDSQLGPQYTVFGHVTGGLNVVDKVAKAGVQGGGTDGKPALPVTIKKVTVSG